MSSVEVKVRKSGEVRKASFCQKYSADIHNLQTTLSIITQSTAHPVISTGGLSHGPVHYETSVGVAGCLNNTSIISGSINFKAQFRSVIYNS